MIRAPSHRVGDEGRPLEIQALLDERFRTLIDEATTSGWTNLEVLDALEELGRNYRVAYDIDPDPEDDPEADPLVDPCTGRDLGP